jgi:predicted  nucleic acid-binding Zn-ribbon protein
MNERQRERLSYLLNEVAVLKQEATELDQTVRMKRAKIEAMRADVLRDANRFANLGRTMDQMKDEIRSLQQS